VDETSPKILKFGSDILTVRTPDVTKIDDRIIDLARRMVETMHRAPGVGLAAPQIGESIRLATVDLSVGENPEELLILINPRIIAHEGSETDDEGCLSVPGFTVPICRYGKIEFETLTLEGNRIRLEAEGLKARAVQHEIDHLDGILILDRVSGLKRALIRQEIKKMKKSGQW
jgi:peptide deformylase